MPPLHRELTTTLTTTMTTVRLPDTSNYTTRELGSRVVTPSACAYGSEGWGFESLRAHSLPPKTLPDNRRHRAARYRVNALRRAVGWLQNTALG
jgi:hypothetical protein